MSAWIWGKAECSAAPKRTPLEDEGEGDDEGEDEDEDGDEDEGVASPAVSSSFPNTKEGESYACMGGWILRSGPAPLLTVIPKHCSRSLTSHSSSTTVSAALPPPPLLVSPLRLKFLHIESKLEVISAPTLCRAFWTSVCVISMNHRHRVQKSWR